MQAKIQKLFKSQKIEIKIEVFQLKDDKVRPDGTPTFFYQHLWEQIGEDLAKMMALTIFSKSSTRTMFSSSQKKTTQGQWKSIGL